VRDKTKTKSTTYKLSVWDLQTGSVLKYLKKDQLVTAQGTLGLETYGDKPMMRLDFASILNYGYTPEKTTIASEKMAFIPIDLDNVKSTTATIKEKKVTVKQ
jgi:WD40 repeat protein